MSTHCQIGFYESNEPNLNRPRVLLYRHAYGYPGGPEGVLATIVPILEDFDNVRGLRDIEYASAWLVKQLKDSYLNIGICWGLRYDIQFYYAIYPDRLDVYGAQGWDEAVDEATHQLNLNLWPKLDSVTFHEEHPWNTKLAPALPT